jgi:hypothetical protein
MEEPGASGCPRRRAVSQFLVWVVGVVLMGVRRITHMDWA